MRPTRIANRERTNERSPIPSAVMRLPHGVSSLDLDPSLWCRDCRQAILLVEWEHASKRDHFFQIVYTQARMQDPPAYAARITYYTDIAVSQLLKMRPEEYLPDLLFDLVYVDPSDEVRGPRKGIGLERLTKFFDRCCDRHEGRCPGKIWMPDHVMEAMR